MTYTDWDYIYTPVSKDISDRISDRITTNVNKNKVIIISSRPDKVKDSFREEMMRCYTSRK